LPCKKFRTSKKKTVYHLKQFRIFTPTWHTKYSINAKK